MHRNAHQIRVVPCPRCGLTQKVTFQYNSVGVERQCIGCGEMVLFELPSPGSEIAGTFKRLFG